MKLTSGMVKMTKTELLVTPRYEQWIRGRQAGDAMSPMAGAIASDTLTAKPRNRAGHFSASALHTCQRAQVYRATNTPQNNVPFDTMTYSVFSNGHYAHLRWQLALIDAGVLTHIEVPITVADGLLKGTVDGINRDEEWGWEFKTIHTKGFSMLTKPKQEHLLQVHVYMLGTGFNTWSIVYEDKNTQDYKEFVVHKDESIESDVLVRVAKMDRHRKEDTVPGRLPSCENQGHAAYQAQRCPFSTVCLGERS